MTQTELVTVELNNGIADVRFNRGDKHNSLTVEMFQAIAAVGRSLTEMPGLRAVVLSGAGKSFCAGLDFSVMQSLLAGGEAAANTEQILFQRDAGPDNLAQRVAYQWKTLAVPVIAAIHGVAYGGGMQIALGCDLRICSADASFSIMEMRYGLIPDMSITQTLPALLPRDVALELTLSARKFGAPEARELGLVTQIADDPHAAAMGLAENIAAQSPDAVRGVKKLYNEAWTAEAGRVLGLEEQLQREIIGQPNQLEAVRAVMEKRPAVFR